jgi:hypothetical protein
MRFLKFCGQTAAILFLALLAVMACPAVHAQRYVLRGTTVGNLPAACEPGQPYLVTDKQDHSDCSGGGGSVRSLCICDAAGTGYDGLTIGTAEVVDDSLLEADLDLTNTPTDEFCLTYEVDAGGDFEWQACASGGTPGGSGTELQVRGGPSTFDPITGSSYTTQEWLTIAQTLDEATGDEVGFTLSPTVNKLTSGNYTAFEIDVTETAAPGAVDRLIDLKVGGTSLAGFTNSGQLWLDINQAFGNTTGITWGDGDTVLYESTDDQLQVRLLGVDRWAWGSTTYGGLAGTNAAIMVDVQPSGTLPGFAFRVDTDTGIGRAAADQLSLIAGGTEGLRFQPVTNGYMAQMNSGTVTQSAANQGNVNWATTLNDTVGGGSDVFNLSRGAITDTAIGAWTQVNYQLFEEDGTTDRWRVQFNPGAVASLEVGSLGSGVTGTTPAADDNDTSIPTTTWVQGERQPRNTHISWIGVAATDVVVATLPPFTGTMTQIECRAVEFAKTGTAVTFTIKVCDGDDTNDDTCTTNLLDATETTTLVCDEDGAVDSSLNSAGFVADDHVTVVLTAVSATAPDQAMVWIRSDED